MNFHMISYAISDPSILHFDRLQEDLQRICKRADYILYRDKDNDDYANFAVTFIREASRYDFSKILLHGDWELAFALGADGVHLKSSQIENVRDAKERELFTIVSTHSLSEMLRAQKLGADMLTLSPLFASPGKGEALGPKRFAELVSQIEIPVIALGGIVSDSRIEEALSTPAAGFASIRYFA